jgi:hypothetical protein
LIEKTLSEIKVAEGIKPFGHFHSTHRSARKVSLQTSSCRSLVMVI